MMLKAVIFATVFTLAASQQAAQQYTLDPNYNVPSNVLFPQGQQYFNNYDGQYQGSYPFYRILRPFKQFPFISLINNENQPLGYFYLADSGAILKQQHNFLPVRDYYGNLLGYYALNLFEPGQQLQPKILNEYIISQLGQFGLSYVPPIQDKSGFLIAKDPYVFYHNKNGILRPNSFQNNFNYQFQQFPYNYFGPYYNGQYQYPQQYFYGQQYQVSQYQKPFNPNYQFLYNYEHNLKIATY